MYKTAVSWLKGVALAIIMLRAGFGLDLQKLKENWKLMSVLSVFPAMVEAAMIAIMAVAVFDFDWAWGFLLGFLIADVSPAVTVPLLLDFQLQGYGTDKGIPTILLAASGFNSVFAICAYGVVKSFIFSSGQPPWLTIILAVVMVGGGILLGIVFGKLVVGIWDAPGAGALSRTGLTVTLALLCIFGTTAKVLKVVDVSGGGVLAVVVLGMYIANTKKGDAGVQQITGILAFAWAQVGQPFLFALLGASVLIENLTPAIVGGGILVIFMGLLLRAAAAYVCAMTTTWNVKEKLFTMITWCPKATVQAALSTVALDYVTDSDNRKEFDDDGGDTDYKTLKDRATIVLTVAVLSIILTAPVFAVAMKWTGEHWLNHDPPKDEDKGTALEIDLGSTRSHRTASLGGYTLQTGRLRGLSRGSATEMPKDIVVADEGADSNL
jgi:NhaP-type Na+/H+ or K+/H+ antiporter